MPPASGSKPWGTWPLSKQLRTLTIDDIRALEIGAAILGTGGGGNPYIGRLRTEQLLKAGLDEMRRTIREVEPVKPSTRLTEELAAASSGSAAQPNLQDGGALTRRRYKGWKGIQTTPVASSAGS